ncbi:MAG: GTPase Era [Neisseriaceae bacterium]
MTNSSFRCGFVAIVGRPNVGKSTLLNHLIGQKISITSKKAQTTRQTIRGIHTDSNAQLIFIDTPGYQTHYQDVKNRKLNENALSALRSADLVVWVVEAKHFDMRDEKILRHLPAHTLLVINKADLFIDQEEAFNFLQQIKGQRSLIDAITVSAKYSQQLDLLIEKIKPRLPLGPPLYPDEALTDRSSRFLVAEILREKVFRYLGEELPYLVEIEINSFKALPTLTQIDATLWITKETHKGIIIGKNGEKLKKISSKARLDMEKLLETKVYLSTWVKVKKHPKVTDLKFLEE